MAFNAPCESGEFWENRYLVTPSEDGAFAGFKDIDSGLSVEGWKVPADSCTPDFAECQPLEYPIW